MDITKFDRITETLAEAPNRRDVLRLLGAAFGVGSLTLLTATEGEAKRRRKSKKRKKQGQTQNPGSSGPSGPICTDGIKNGSESDVDCGGTCPRCQGGQICNSRNDCHTALCTGGTCQSCAAANDCGLDSDGDTCFCRDNAAKPGERMCTRKTCKLFIGGTCANCAAGEQCAPAGAGAIECCTPCGA